MYSAAYPLFYMLELATKGVREFSSGASITNRIALVLHDHHGLPEAVFPT
jgi:hypothetical protein